jgi:hypothetical protein
MPVVYQKDKPELLINTEWGLAYRSVPDAEAKAQGLVLWNDRWVSPEDKKRLIEEQRVYRWIHGSALLFTLAGVVGGVMALGQLMGHGSLETVIEGAVNLFCSVLALVVAFLLRLYNPMGRWTAIVLGVWNLLATIIVMVTGTSGQGLRGKTIFSSPEADGIPTAAES